jgi:ABC-2 type transport system permease protein
MSNQTVQRWIDDLNIIWTIAAKDIVDALKARWVISVMILVSLMLLLPKMIPWVMEQPVIGLPIYDPGGSNWVAELNMIPDVAVQKVSSEQEFQAALCNAIFPTIGLRLTPAQGDVRPLELAGYVCWSKRFQVAETQVKLAERLSKALGQRVSIRVAGNVVYPPAEAGIFLNVATMNWVIILLMMGIFLVPNLLYDEKQTKTIQALLVSPASIGQVVLGKAVVGWFYILVAAGVMFAISWEDVIHWDIIFLFVAGSGLFGVAVGLVLGSFYEKQQDGVGVTGLIAFLLVGAMLTKMPGLSLPAALESVLYWIPSVALAEMGRAALAESVPAAQVWTRLGMILLISLPLYLLVIWKVRRSDRQ